MSELVASIAIIVGIIVWKFYTGRHDAAMRQEWQAVADRLGLDYEANSQVASSLLTGRVGGWSVEVWVKDVRINDQNYELRGVIEAEVSDLVPGALALESIERVGTPGITGPDGVVDRRLADAYRCKSSEEHLERIRQDEQAVGALLELYAVESSVELSEGVLTLMSRRFVTDGTHLEEALERVADVLEALDRVFDESDGTAGDASRVEW